MKGLVGEPAGVVYDVGGVDVRSLSSWLSTVAGVTVENARRGVPRPPCPLVSSGEDVAGTSVGTAVFSALLFLGIFPAAAESDEGFVFTMVGFRRDS
jgi:hypothetical protein